VKKIIASVFFVLMASVVIAQSFTVTTVNVNFSGNAQSTDIPSPYWTPVVHNVSGDTLQLRWVRAEQNIPGWWRSSVCTEYYCYSIPDDSATWTLLPGDSDMLYVHIYPYGYADTGNVVLRLFNANDITDSSRIVFNCHVPVGIEEYSLLSDFRTDYSAMTVGFASNSASVYELTDATGKSIVTGIVLPGEGITIPVSIRGMYLLILQTEDGRRSVRRFVI
jgi:hypothetical protein